MRYFILTMLLLLFSMGCAQSKAKPITEVSQNELNSVILIDVRTPEEFEAGHIDNAQNMNWFDKDFTKKMKAIDKKETVYVYCKKGGRSAKAAQLLDSLGYKKVIDLVGGYDAYSQK